MMDESFPEEVLKLRPRKVRLGRDLERSLEDICGADKNHLSNGGKYNLRPIAGSINAAHCAACGQIEYITRDYCRCGHYLSGQIIDEYLAWERDLATTKDQLALEAEEKLKPFRWIIASAIPFAIWPIIQFLVNGREMPPTTWLWIFPGMLIFTLYLLIEYTITAKREASANAVESATYEQFLIDRISSP